MNNRFFDSIVEDETNINMIDPNQMSLPWEDIAELDEQRQHMEDDTPPDFSDLEH